MKEVTKMLRLTAALLTASLLMTGCSIIVESNCGDEENNFCPAGYRCFEGRCVPESSSCDAATECDLATSDECCPSTCNEFNDVDCCLEECCCEEPSRCIDGLCREPSEEECNNIDDDFDGSVDEGFDVDGDGVSSCAFVDTIPDCDDTNADVRPGLPEVCDGHDNDCDGNVDDGDLCPTGETCHLTLHTCVERTSCADGDPCPPGRFCHSDEICYPDEVHFGDACILPTQCTTGRCLLTSGLGMPGRHCTNNCCSEADCPTGTFCALSDSGIKLCAPPDWFGWAGVNCGEETCEACWQGQCRTPCCGDRECAWGCQLAEEVSTPRGPVETTLCDIRTTGGFAIGRYEESDCGMPGGRVLSYCASGLHWVVETVMGIAVRCICSAPCCEHADCTFGGDDPGAICAVTPDGQAMCYPSSLAAVGSLEFGQACDDPGDCASGACHPEGYCTSACCTSATCPGASFCVPTPGPSGIYANLCTRP